MSEKQDWRWLSQWTPTFAVLVALLAAVVPASFHLGGEMGRLGSELGRLDEGQAELKAGLVRVEKRVDSLAERMETRMDSFETRMETRMDAFEARMETRMDAVATRFEAHMEALLGELRDDLREGQADMANVRERVTALEAAS